MAEKKEPKDKVEEGEIERTIEKEMESKEGLLIPAENYLRAGVHIGTRILHHHMKPFVYKKREDGIFILDINQTDKRIRQAASLLAHYRPEEVLVTASRTYSSLVSVKLGQVTGMNTIRGRFIPGTLTNKKLPFFKEPSILLVSDPRAESVAVKEAAVMNIPVVALCDTDNSLDYVDFAIPTNNKGKKAIAMVYFLLARSYMVSKGLVKDFSDFKHTLLSFEEAGEEGQE
ncbi:MAG: 30S ribosomal protein S2 [Candidatus Anstonellales archaeon]